MQPVALAHALGQQPDDGVAVFQQFGHASRDQRLALGPGLVGCSETVRSMDWY